MKKQVSVLATLLAISCAHSDRETASSSGDSASASASSSSEAAKPIQAKGYGDFLYMPPGSIAIRNFVDKDGDGVDDRYQMGPGQKGLPMGHLYKK